VRKLGIACIATLLQTNVVEKEPLVRILPSLQPPIVSGLDEDYEETTRYLSCIALASLFRKISPHADGVFFCVVVVCNARRDHALTRRLLSSISIHR
jgi:hypothetical protein